MEACKPSWEVGDGVEAGWREGRMGEFLGGKGQVGGGMENEGWIPVAPTCILFLPLFPLPYPPRES